MAGKLIIFLILVTVSLVTPVFAVDCADGYSDNGNGVCIATCAPGYRVENVGDPCTQITGTDPIYTDTTHTVIYGETSGDNVKTCPPAPADNPCTEIRIPASISHTTRLNCLCDNMINRFEYGQGRTNYGLSVATHGTASTACYYRCYHDECYYGAKYCVNGVQFITCDAGFYSVMGNEYMEGEMASIGCMPVGINYYSPDGDLNRYPCPDGTITTGYGDGAKSIDDCKPYKTLNIGNDNQIMMTSVKQTNPTLAILYNGDVFYAAATTLPHTNTMHFLLNDTVYSVVNPLDQFEHVIYPATARYHPYGDDDYEVIVVP